MRVARYGQASKGQGAQGRAPAHDAHRRSTATGVVLVDVFDLAAVTIAGVELLHRIRKGQFNLGRLRIACQAAPAIWKAVLLA